MAVNDWFLSHLANILGAEVARPVCVETSAIGAAYLAGLQANIYESLDELTQMWQCERTFSPTIDKSFRDHLYDGWLEAVSKVQTS
jgi:glycerol kinase